MDQLNNTIICIANCDDEFDGQNANVISNRILAIESSALVCEFESLETLSVA